MKLEVPTYLFLSLLVSTTGICDPKVDRHCEKFPERDVDSVFPVDPIEPDPGPIEVLPDDDNNNGVGPVEPEIPRDGNGNNIPLLPIVGASVGGIALIVAAAFFRRRKLATATDDGLSGIDSSAMGPSNSDDV